MRVCGTYAYIAQSVDACLQYICKHAQSVDACLQYICLRAHSVERVCNTYAYMPSL